ncbi:MAG: LiaF-related protein [Pelolinea sp.]|nr:LiaF-related protein [Pelolinea sp.]
MSETQKTSVTSVFNDIRRKFNSPDFDGGYITSVLGSADMDLREAKMKGTEAVLDITNILSSTYIYPAADWDVRLELTEVAGNVKDRREETAKGKKKLLRITGITVLGDVYIR